MGEAIQTTHVENTEKTMPTQVHVQLPPFSSSRTSQGNNISGNDMVRQGLSGSSAVPTETRQPGSTGDDQWNQLQYPRDTSIGSVTEKCDCFIKCTCARKEKIRDPKVDRYIENIDLSYMDISCGYCLDSLSFLLIRTIISYLQLLPD